MPSHTSSLSSSPIHPINRLPPELLSTIFLHSLQDVVQPFISEAPLNISSVSNAWRHISTTTPPLWSEIYIQRGRGCQYVPTIRMWVSRSGRCGLSFSIRWRSLFGLIHEILDVLLEHFTVWRNVQINASHLTVNSLLDVIPTHTPTIRKLSILDATMAGPQDVFARRLFMNPPLASPMPTDILSDVPVHSSIQIHWRNLAPDSLWSLNLGETVTSAFLECLSRFPRLQEFKAYFKLSPAQRLTQPPSILNRDHAHFTHLKRLELTLELEPKLDDTLDENPHPLLAELFDGIRLPALTTLRLNGGGQGGLDPQWRPCINFIRRFKFTLEHLEIVLPSVLLPPHFLDSESFVNLKHLAHWLTRRLLRHWFIESPWEDMYYPTFYNHTHRSCTRN